MRRADQNVRVIAAIARTCLTSARFDTIADLADAVKEQAARAHIAYDSGSVTRAIASAMAQRRRGA